MHDPIRVCGGRELCRRLKTDLLIRWFLDLQPSDDVFDLSVFTHNRERLSEHGLTQKLFDQVVKQAIAAPHKIDDQRHRPPAELVAAAGLHLKRRGGAVGGDGWSGGRTANTIRKGLRRWSTVFVPDMVIKGVAWEVESTEHESARL